MKERVENKQQWIADAFASNPHTVQNNPQVAKFRQQQLTQFMQRGFPTRREEMWKYTDISFIEKKPWYWPEIESDFFSSESAIGKLAATRAQDNTLLVFINGRFSTALSSIGDLPRGVIVSNLQQSLRTHTALIHAYLLRQSDVQNHPLACLNAAMLADGLFLYVPGGIILEKPVHVLAIATGGKDFMVYPRHVVIMESDTQLTLTEEYRGEEDSGAYLTNAALDIFVGRNAQLNYYKIQNEGENATHFSTLFLHQQKHSLVNICSFSVGGQFARDDIFVKLQEKNTTCSVKGFYGLSRDQQFIDHHLFIEHAAENTRSEMDYRGILAKSSRAVFNGKVMVRPLAKKTQAQQLNHNVLLSSTAEVNTKPELEIYADDVQCRHGATVGQLDEDALFYLCARGIDKQTAKMMMLEAFTTEVLGSVLLPWLAEYMQEQWRKRLANL